MSKPSTKHAAAAKNADSPSGFFARVRARGGRMSTPLDWLLSLLLVLQLVGASAYASPASLGQSVQAPDAGLSAALGEPVPICAHGDPDSPTPSMPADCGHCTLCHVMAGGAPLPTIPGLAVPAAVVTTIEHPPLAAPAAMPRRAGSTSPRGPPSLA
ncbi:hypothetical protein [Beijerinckia sp. L45]|uniref:hypothetical protein n=1 Tax=Beijerinckia sp. L45 TaxID=1641855 RepID=UPI00131D76CD|nr:hypothetical protein [Beijerinckia sp. L45]